VASADAWVETAAGPAMRMANSSFTLKEDYALILVLALSPTTT
jgi:hypothetical protein